MTAMLPFIQTFTIFVASGVANNRTQHTNIYIIYVYIMTSQLYNTTMTSL